MFDTVISTPSEPSLGGAGVLSPANIAQWKDGLGTTLEANTGLDDAERIDALRALEELVCAATAAQAALAAELDESRHAVDADAGVPARRRGKGTSSLVAFARRESPHRGQGHLGLAKVVRVELPHTWAAWRTGRVTEWTATVIARETACLTLEHRLAVDEAVAGDGERLEGMGTGELVGVLRAEAEQLDPAAVVKRRRRAEAERRVSLRPAPDTMTYLTALLPVKDGVAAYAALMRVADAVRAGGDERPRGQVMADELVNRIKFDADNAPTPSSQATPSSETGTPTSVAQHSVELCLIMTDHALFGGADDVARIHGYGPIPAELAREIVADTLTARERVGIRRLYTSPGTGELVAMESATRTFRGNLAKFIKLRDQTCRTPWCDAPIRHVDHAVPDIRGGPTSATNGQGLCEACNYAKEGTGWHTRPGSAGAIETRLPTGHRYHTRPPSIATITHADPPLRIDYALTG